jgi:plastocyanin
LAPKITEMKKIIISLSLALLGTAGFCNTWTIINSGFTFSPATVTINLGDDVNLILESMHNAVEVNQSTWNANGNTALTGGFQTSFGGGSVPSSKLGVGTHYYVCSPHASIGMKGIIIVQNPTGITDNNLPPNFTIYPNPSDNLITIRTNNNMAGTQFFITDQTGRLVSNGKLVNDATSIDISQLASGIYLVQMAGQRKQSIKMVKH